MLHFYHNEVRGGDKRLADTGSRPQMLVGLNGIDQYSRVRYMDYLRTKFVNYPCKFLGSVEMQGAIIAASRSL